MQRWGEKSIHRTRDRASTTSRRLVPAVLPVLLAVSCAVSAAGYKRPAESALDGFAVFDESKVEQWKELAAALPAFPADPDLIAVRMPVTYTLKVYLDEKSISLAADGISRFTLVIESTSGSRNVFFEGYNCGTREYKIYASGTADKTFEPIKQPKWERVPYYETNAFRYQLLRYYVCDPNALSMALSARNLIHRLKSGMNE